MMNKNDWRLTNQMNYQDFKEMFQWKVIDKITSKE